MAATATAQKTKPGKLISSRFTGTKCKAGDFCLGSGLISRGDMIRWIAGNRFSKALVYHDICFDALWEQGKIGTQAAGGSRTGEEDSATNPTSGNGGSRVYQGNGVSGFELQAQDVQGELPSFEGSMAQDSLRSNVDANASLRPPASSARNGSGAIWSMFADEIAPFLDERLSAKLDRAEVEAIVSSLLEASGRVCTVVLQDAVTGETRDMGVQHKCFADLLRVAQARTADGYRLNAWLAGPAGSGKTTAAKRVAEALGLAFYAHGAMDTSFQLLGYMDAQGRYVSTEFRKAYESGGVCLLDEVDSWSPSAQLALNGALANGECSFPDGMVNRHPDFVCVACANTWGLGGTNDYVGRLKLDAAFLDRFIPLDWPIDEDLETATCGNVQWSKRVQEIRARVRAKGIKAMISPRASYYGAALLGSGMPQERVEALAIRKAMTDDQWSQVREAN